MSEENLLLASLGADIICKASAYRRLTPDFIASRCRVDGKNGYLVTATSTVYISDRDLLIHKGQIFREWWDEMNGRVFGKIFIDGKVIEISNDWC